MAQGGWYYVDAAQTRIGPIEASELDRLMNIGSVGANTLVWRQGMSGWEPAGTQFAAAGPMGGPPPVAAPAGMRPGTMASASTAGQIGGQPGPLYPGAPARGFGEAISVCFNKFASFKGRASRSEFWFFFLFAVLVGVGTALIDLAIFGPYQEISPISTLASLVLLLPNLAVGWRRLHDTGRSGWIYGGLLILAGVGAALIVSIALADPWSDLPGMLTFIFAIAGLAYYITLIVFWCLPGDPHENRYG